MILCLGVDGVSAARCYHAIYPPFYSNSRSLSKFLPRRPPPTATVCPGVTTGLTGTTPTKSRTTASPFMAAQGCVFCSVELLPMSAGQSAFRLYRGGSCFSRRVRWLRMWFGLRHYLPHAVVAGGLPTGVCAPLARPRLPACVPGAFVRLVRLVRRKRVFLSVAWYRHRRGKRVFAARWRACSGPAAYFANRTKWDNLGQIGRAWFGLQTFVGGTKHKSYIVLFCPMIACGGCRRPSRIRNCRKRQGMPPPRQRPPQAIACRRPSRARNRCKR